MSTHEHSVFFQIAWLMQVTMGTSATETLSVAGNIFVSQVGAAATQTSLEVGQGSNLIQGRAV